MRGSLELPHSSTHNSVSHPTLSKHVLHVVTDESTNIIYDSDHNHFFNLNNTALEMWRQLTKGNSDSEIVSNMALKYGVPERIVREDLCGVLRNFAEQELTPDALVLIDVPEPAPAQSGTSISPIRHGTTSNTPTNVRSILSAYIGLCYFDLFMRLWTFKALCLRISRWPVAPHPVGDIAATTQECCAAVNRACIWYPKKVLCLQRSAITTCLLRSRGIEARMAIGVRPVPFLAHAWVEINDCVVNDLPRVREFYRRITSY